VAEPPTEEIIQEIVLVFDAETETWNCIYQ
jgi:hypothetical protein